MCSTHTPVDGYHFLSHNAWVAGKEENLHHLVCSSFTHRIYHHTPLENGHKVSRLLAHGHSHLHRLTIKLLVQNDSLVSGSSDLILAGMAALGNSN